MKTFQFIFALLLSLTATTAFAAQKDLAQLSARMQATQALGIAPLAVLDLDETLVISTARTFFSFQQAFETLNAKYPNEVAKTRALQLRDYERLANHYDYSALFRLIGVTNAAFIQEATTEMLKHYLSAEFMSYDREMPCATTMVRKFYSMGGGVIFVSSRFQKAQGKATIESLNRLGIIRPGDRYKLLLRPEGMPSLEFKKKSFAWAQSVKEWAGKPAQIVLASENEPENMNAMLDSFPAALHYFVAGAFLKPEPLKAPVYTIRNFCF